jgi:hypothetical protein
MSITRILDNFLSFLLISLSPVVFHIDTNAEKLTGEDIDLHIVINDVEQKFKFSEEDKNISFTPTTTGTAVITGNVKKAAIEG